MTIEKRRWKFRIEGHNKPGGCVDAAGNRDDDCEFIGTSAEAAREANRRADAWERVTGDLCESVTLESQGKGSEPQPGASPQQQRNE
jgi:uncharacterized membrane protein